MTKTITTVPFSFRLDQSIKDKLEIEAKELDRSASYIAVKAIEWYLQAKEEKRKVIDEAVKRADKGIFISQDAVHKWVDSWGTENELPIPEPDVFLHKERLCA